MKTEDKENWGWDAIGLAALILSVSLAYCGCAVGMRIERDGFPWSPAKEAKEAKK